MDANTPSKYPWANKKLGQHFLRDKKVIDKITQDLVNKNLLVNCDGIIEIGPGPGVLTENLAKLTTPLHVIETDERFIPYLTQWITAQQITLGDALNIEINKLLEDLKWCNIWLVSNLPYNISVPLLIRFLPLKSIKFLTLMFQREVANKILGFDTDPSKAMGSLMALTQTYFEVELNCQVPPGAFSPPPQVGSTVLSLKRREHTAIPIQEFQVFESFLRSLFQFKRKQLQKVLQSRYSKPEIADALKNLQILPSLRAEALNLSQVQLLYQQFHS